MPVITVESDDDFVKEMNKAGEKLVVVGCGAAWCGACKGFAKTFEALSEKYSNAVFLSVDVDKAKSTGAKYHISSMPTFVFVKNNNKLDTVEGADKAKIEQIMATYYREESSGAGVPGMMDLNTMITKAQSECLNEADDHPYEHCLQSGGGYLESDCDPEIILSLSFNQMVKVHSIKIKAPSDKGPKNLRIFMNQPNTLDFEKASSMIATQDLTLTPGQLDGSPISLKFVKFQNVQNLQFFFKDNQGDEETTQIDYLSVIGAPVGTTNMNEFKRVAGKKGEGH